MLIDIMSPLQSSFIPGRGIVDNVIVLQEFIYHTRKSNKKHIYVIYKFDLDNSYDRLDWTFPAWNPATLWFSFYHHLSFNE